MNLRQFIFGILSLLSLCAFGQTVQKGVVKEYNEKNQKTPLSGVELNIRSANSTVSDENGAFSLSFITMKPGERINVRRIEKLGYEVFNTEAIEQWNLNPTTPFIIIMCRSDRFKKIRDNYQKVSSESYARQLKKEETALAKLKEEGKLKEEEYLQQLFELKENYEKQLDKIENYIDHFSRIDLSELSTAEIDIITLVQQGKIEEAITKYEQQNYVDKYAQEIAQIKELSAAIDKLENVKYSKEISRDSILSSIDRQIETFRLAGGKENIDKIGSILQQITEIDSTNALWQLKYSEYLSEYESNYEKGIAIVKYVLDNSLCSSIFEKCEALIILGKIYGIQGNYDSAIVCFDDALSILLSENIENEQLTKCYLGLSSAYGYQNKYQEALDYAQRSLDLRLKLFGEIDKDVASSLNNIGIIYGELKNYDLGLESLNKALHIRVQIFGENSIPVADTYNAMAAIYVYKNDLLKSLELFEKTLNIKLDSLGESHINVAVALNNLAFVNNELQRYEEAKLLYQQCLDTLKNIFGNLHPHIASVLNNLGQVFENDGDYIEALSYYNQSYDTAIALYGNNHLSVCYPLNSIGHIYQIQGDYKMALECQLKNLKIFKSIDENHPLISNVLCNIADIYEEQKEYNEALQYYFDAEQFLSKIQGDLFIDNAPILFNLAKINIKLNEHLKAIPYLDKALTIWDANGIKNAGIIEPLCLMATCHEYLNNSDEANVFLRRAYEIAKLNFGEDDSKSVEIHNRIDKNIIINEGCQQE